MLYPNLNINIFSQFMKSNSILLQDKIITSMLMVHVIFGIHYPIIAYEIFCIQYTI